MGLVIIMKIKNKIIALFSIIIVVVILLGWATKAFVSEHYIHYKYDNAYAHYYNQELTTSQFSEYLINEGFIVTEQEIPEYKTEGNISCHIEDDQIIVYENNKPVLYAVLNENIVTDLNRLLIYAAIFVNILVLIMLVIIYVYFNKSILFKLNKLELEMANFKEVDSFEVSEINTANEIDLLTDEFYKLANMIKQEDKQKKFLIMTLSHELKNPMSNIEAVIDMNRLGIAPYSDNQEQNQLIEVQLEKMKSIVIDLLNTYKFDINQPPVEIDVLKTVEKVVSDNQLPTSELEFKYQMSNASTITINNQVFIYIVSNIISNIYKYSQPHTVVKITISESSIKFENVRSQQVEDKSTEIGLLLNKYLSNEIGIDIHIEEDEKKYTTIIDF